VESYSQRKMLRKKVIVTKLGLDGHDRGAKVIAHSLMEAGYEVVYLGVHRTVQQVVSAVVQEDAALLAVSVLSGAHLELAKDLISEMKRQKVNCPIVMGGIIPRQDIAKLKRMGIKEVFGPGTSLELIEEAVGKWIK
jgi:methylmalonyl-CoA mutase C-terminal domain/subunit